MTDKNRVWRLAKRPQGDLADGDLDFTTEDIPQPDPGEILLKTSHISLDPTNRIWMSDMDQYMPPINLGDPVRAIVMGEVIESCDGGPAVGSLVGTLGGWADYLTVPAKGIFAVDGMGIDPVDAFAMFSLVGPTAYFGLMDIGTPQEGETLVVSAAAGAVGSLVGQMGKIKGCRVVGIAGSDAKCSWITEELGFDGAINYKTEDIGARLDALCPDGIDIYFENVGGEIFELVLERMNDFGRVPLCGLISQYNSTEEVRGPRNFTNILMHRLTVRGYIATDYMKDYPTAIGEMAQWMAAGKLKLKLDIRQGLETAPETLKLLYSGGNDGKLLLKV